MTVKIITDSSAGIPKDLRAQEDISVASLTIHTADGEYIDSEIDLDWFYARYLTDLTNIPTSSQPSVEQMREHFVKAAEEGRDALAVVVSSKLSGTIQSARIAGEMVAKEYQGWKHDVIDSASTSFQEAFAVLAAATAAKAGKTIEECSAAVEYVKARTKFLFVPATLENLRAGGRIGRATALLGGALKIRPVLGVKDGEANIFKTVRTQKKALETMVDLFKADVERCGLADIVVHYIGAHADGVAFAKEYVEPILGREVPIYPVSPVVGVHVGTAVGFVYQTERELW